MEKKEKIIRKLKSFNISEECMFLLDEFVKKESINKSRLVENLIRNYLKMQEENQIIINNLKIK